MGNKPQGLYLLQDGTHADPADVSADKAGVLRHKNGLAVCLYEDGRPQTVGEDAERNKNVDAAAAGPRDDGQKQLLATTKPPEGGVEPRPVQQRPPAAQQPRTQG